jgi:stage II sporulation protein D
VFLGTKAQSAQTDAAVAATAGQVVTYGGRPAITYFFASSGGATEDVQNAFPGAAPEPWLQGVPDPFDQGPQHRWRVSMSFHAAAARLRGLVKGAFRGVEVLRRGYSPRIVSAYVLGSGGRTVLSGAELAERLGLYDTWAYFSVRTAHGVRADGDPRGHRSRRGHERRRGNAGAERRQRGAVSRPAGAHGAGAVRSDPRCGVRC